MAAQSHLLLRGLAGRSYQDATWSQLGSRADSGAITGQTTINFNTPNNYGATDPTRRIYLLISGSGTNTMTSVTHSSNSLPFLLQGNVALTWLDWPTGSAGQTFSFHYSSTAAKNLSIWTFRATNLMELTADQTAAGVLNGASGSYPLTVNAKRGYVLVGGTSANSASSFSVTGIANADESWVSTNRRWGFWETLPSAINPKTVTVTQGGAAPNSQSVLWVLR